MPSPKIPRDGAALSPAEARRDLERRIREVAATIRRRAWMRRWAGFGAFTLAAVSVFTFLLVRADSIGVERNAAILCFAVVELAYFLVRVLLPMRERPSPRQVALYIDERHPELENRILSAVEFGGGPREGESAVMIERCIAETGAFAAKISWRELVDPAFVLRSLLVAVFFLMLSGGVVLSRLDAWTPRFSLAGASSSPAAARSLDFTVEPGNARVRVGDSQTILAKSDARGRVAGIVWRAEGAEWTTEPMDQGSDASVHHYRFASVLRDIEYRVTMGSESSPVYKLTAWTPPEVASIDLTYRYPDYLEWAPHETPNGGAISAVEGTRVELSVETNKAVKSAVLALESGERVPLVRRTDALWEGELLVESDDAYRVELVDLDGAASEFDPRYAISARPDKPPEVKIEFPRGDGEVTALEEVPFAFRVNDDFGIADYGLQYEIVGRETKRLALADAAAIAPVEGEPVRSAEGGHTFLMENMDLRAGDLVTWSVWAKDRKPDRPADDEFGDLFFLEVRPFRQTYEEAVSNQGGQQGMQGGQEEAQQKEIVVATWNLKRDAPRLTPEEFEGDRAVVLDAQTELLTKTEAAAAQVEGDDAEMRELAKEMALAIESLKAASLPDPAASLSSAIGHMQNAYRLILRTKPRHTQIQQQMQGGGGGGGGSRPELDGLELDRNKNFYEDEKRTGEDRAATEEALSRLKELAQRQQAINEEIARLVSEIQAAKTEEERREIERRLEKLRAEEKQAIDRLDEVRGELQKSGMDPERRQETMQGLDEVRRDMNRSLERLRSDRLQEARASGRRAETSLQDLGERLESLSRAAAHERMNALRESLDELRAKQDEIAKAAEEAKAAKESGKPEPGTLERLQAEALEKKKEVAEGFAETMNEAADLAEKSAQSQELMSRKLGDWLRETSRDGIAETIEEGKPLLEYGVWESAAEREREAKEKLDAAARRLEEVAAASVEDDVEALGKALERLDSLLAGAEAESAGEARDGEGERPGAKGEDGERLASGAEPGAEPGAESGAEPGDVRPEDRRLSDALNAEAERAMRDGRLDEARERLERALAADPTNAQARRNMAAAAEAAGDRRGALEEMAEHLGADPSDPRVREELAQAMEEATRRATEAGRRAFERREAAERGEQAGGEPGEREPGESSEPGGPGDEASREPGEPGEAGAPGEENREGDQSGEGEGGESREPSEGREGRGESPSPGNEPGESGREGEREGRGDRPGGRQGRGERPGEPGAPPPDGSPEGSEPGGSLDGRATADSSDPNPDASSSGGRGGAARNPATRLDGGDSGDPNARFSEAGPGRWEDANLPPPEAMEDFIREDYSRWVERLREAEALLPKDSPHRRDIERVRNRIEKMRQEYKRHSLEPKYDLLLGEVVSPMAETAGRIENELLKALKEKEFVLTDEGEAPSQYRRRVADYFESLASIESGGPAGAASR